MANFQFVKRGLRTRSTRPYGNAWSLTIRKFLATCWRAPWDVNLKF